MAYLYYSTWLLAEQLRLFSDLALEGCRWWNWPPEGSGSSAPQAPACGLAPPPAYFERLVGIAERIVDHATFPGKHTAVEQCLEEVGDLIAAGRITAGQGAILADILLGVPTPGWRNGRQGRTSTSSGHGGTGEVPGPVSKRVWPWGPGVRCRSGPGAMRPPCLVHVPGVPQEFRGHQTQLRRDWGRGEKGVITE